MSDEQIMKQLVEYAWERMEKANAYPFCAFVVRDGVVVSRGFNNVENSYGDRTTHGEMVAMKKATWALKTGYVLEGYRLFSTCEPCLACLDSALWVGIRDLVYAVDHNDFPEYFNDHGYYVDNVVGENPDLIKVKKGGMANEVKQLFGEAKKKYGW